MRRRGRHEDARSRWQAACMVQCRHSRQHRMNNAMRQCSAAYKACSAGSSYKAMQAQAAAGSSAGSSAAAVKAGGEDKAHTGRQAEKARRAEASVAHVCRHAAQR